MNTGDKGEWWEEFFHGPWGELQARGYPPERTTKESEFIVTALDLKAGDKVLDLACGIGRHAIELADRGIEVTGLDFNGDALDIARHTAAERGVHLELVERDMRDIGRSGEFDAVVCFWTSFGYFEDEADDLTVAKQIAKALRPGGRFLLDLLVVETLAPRFQPRLWDWLDEGHSGQVLQEVQWDFRTGRTISEWTFIEAGRVRTSRASLRLYSCRELCDLLRAAGFSEFEAVDTLTGQPFALGSKRLSLVASL